ncbi:hypothetical protein [Desulfitobacterium chlororespirans]|uniref:Uncharacterized protein n=1 Tax=Desulfitobacterium chlororespirans DSM 11544 TaxID=1121395 RepID=A0A1M7UT25_9FIRM|nr:hypothetical protein [Desulfitobacterium chlororespirans]SHN86181.1 hypothetical protein SAMN02745215_04602 [Desulfitobacterium chlororespirans DSM 11544]
MMYPYMTFADETEIVHSHIIEDNGVQRVEVHFERPTEEGFDMARCVLPTYTWIRREGFTDQEISKFERFLRSNAHLLYRYAAAGGIKIA